MLPRTPTPTCGLATIRCVVLLSDVIVVVVVVYALACVPVHLHSTASAQLLPQSHHMPSITCTRLRLHVEHSVSAPMLGANHHLPACCLLAACLLLLLRRLLLLRPLLLLLLLNHLAQLIAKLKPLSRHKSKPRIDIIYEPFQVWPYIPNSASSSQTDPPASQPPSLSA